MARSRFRWVGWLALSLALLAVAVGGALWLLFRPLAPARRFPISVASFHGVTCSPDGRLLLRGCQGESVDWRTRHFLVVHDVETGEEIGRQEAFEDWAGFLPDGGVVGVRDDNTLCVWDPATWQVRETLEVRPRRGESLQAASLSTDGSRLVVNLAQGDSDAGFRGEVWDLARRRRLYDLPRNTRMEGLSPSGRYLLAHRLYDRTEQEEAREGQQLLKLEDDAPSEVALQGDTSAIWSYALLPKGDEFLVWTAEGLEFWSLSTATRLRKVAAAEVGGSIQGFSPDGEYALLWGEGAGVLDLATGEVLVRLTEEGFPQGGFVSASRLFLVGEGEAVEWRLPPRWILLLRGRALSLRTELRTRWEEFWANPPTLPWP